MVTATNMEQRCIKALTELDIEFMYNSPHDSLRSGTDELLIFDFIIPTMDESYFMIECKGIHHYKNSSVSVLRKLSIHDSIKEYYCQFNQYPLLVIKYDDIRSYKEIIQQFIKENQIKIYHNE